MTAHRVKQILLLALLVLPSACAENSMVYKGKVAQFEQQKVAMTNQMQEALDRANKLDKQNQEMTSLLAQTRQQSKVFEDQLQALRDQLQTVGGQLAQVQTDNDSKSKMIQTLNASLQRSGSVSISPNSSLSSALPVLNLPEVSVRRDGDVVRVELPATRLFENGSSRLKNGGHEMVTAAALELQRLYPDQIIGIEGYTDNDPITTGQWRNNHELSVARAMTVYDILITRTRLQGDQLFISGHGANHPIVPNTTPDNKQRNRRIELVVYPEKK